MIIQASLPLLCPVLSMSARDQTLKSPDLPLSHGSSTVSAILLPAILVSHLSLPHPITFFNAQTISATLKRQIPWMEKFEQKASLINACATMA